ncbi:Zinc finger BED domain-containing protein RICESLEEPER 2 [Vitis vinifera]|uniref:Zinc finger BED domain-containing protein RICESLEEPER 2 n=1 Tax=Vitis vinifera TaxID=29760 RepID=A0A438I479_VITVI|nr:Zinc finger BED domain-containing protein RICESLEEPER 2 [Vitis vinifera]
MDRKLSTITVDNCSSNDGMIDILSEKLSSSGSLLLNGKIFHMRCATHVLNLIVKEDLDVIRVEIEKIRESVAYWSATPSRVEKFEDAARQLRLPCNKKLCLDCETRWNSTYLMLSIAITYKDVFPRLKQREKLYTTVPSEEEWNLAREICERLKLFYNITKLFSGRNYPTANTFFIKVCEIKEALYDWLICSNEVVSTMASSMLEKFDKYWSGCHIVMAIAVVLDPRYKMKILEFYFPIMYGSEASSEIGKIRQLCYDLLSEYQSKSKMGQQTSSHGASSVSNLFELTYDEQDPLSKFDLFVHSTSEEGHAKSELDYYLEETVLPRISDFDVLSWWKTNGIKYPTLQMIVRDIYAIPVSTVASESAFSTGGRMVSKHRSRLHPNTLEALMCAQSWLGNEMEGGKLTIMDEDDESLLLIKVVFFGKEGISADLIAVNEDVRAACWGISVYISPMPLGIVVAGARLLKNKATYYGTAVDLWSTGCILAELYAGKPIMPGRTEVGSGLRGSAMLVWLVVDNGKDASVSGGAIIGGDGGVEQLHKIFKLCGSPSEDYWRKSKLPHATIFKPQQPYRRCVAETFKDFPTPALGLMETLLSIDPAYRGSAASALKIKPLPCDPSSLPKYPHSKEFDAKMVRNFRGPLLELLQSGDIDLCFANEDETRELLRDDENASLEAALEFLAKHYQWAVVTLGSNRCLAKCGRERQIDVDMYITHLKLYAHLLHIAVGGCCTVDKGGLQLLQSPPLWSPFEWPLEV